jgi:2-phosphoglycerate kinase
MSKPIVIHEDEGDRVPFLRGILVQSLVNSGLSFEDAYAVAQTMRKRLRDRGEVTAAALQGCVADLLEQRFGPELRQAYEADRLQEGRQVLVHTASRSAPFSVGRLTHSLEACALDPETARIGALKVEEVLAESGHREVHSRTLRRLVAHCLQEYCSPQDAERYLAWRRFVDGGTPLILLVGGITGSGKSTLATELAYRLNIVRTQSTDLMREIMRAMLPSSVLPTLTYSSFNAWQGLVLPGERGGEADPDTVARGYLAQVAAVKLPLEATLKRAVQESHHLIVDGVHVLPNHLRLGKIAKKAVVVCIMLAVMSKKTLRQRLKWRAGQHPGRHGQAHLSNVDVIWDLQSFLLSEADRANVPIIVNHDLDEAVRDAMRLIGRPGLHGPGADPGAGPGRAGRGGERRHAREGAATVLSGEATVPVLSAPGWPHAGPPGSFRPPRRGATRPTRGAGGGWPRRPRAWRTGPGHAGCTPRPRAPRPGWPAALRSRGHPARSP